MKRNLEEILLNYKRGEIILEIANVKYDKNGEYDYTIESRYSKISLQEFEEMAYNYEIIKNANKSSDLEYYFYEIDDTDLESEDDVQEFLKNNNFNDYCFESITRN